MRSPRKLTQLGQKPQGRSRMFLVISSSLNPNSRSRILANDCLERLKKQKRDVEWFDLAESTLPPCDGGAAYGDPNAQTLASLIQDAEAVFLASPVYNFDVNSVAKNAIELTSRAWTGKVVSIMLAAGGQGSYMSAMGLANSLMLDYRCIIVPRFVYTLSDAFEHDQIVDESVRERMQLLVSETTAIADALSNISLD